MDVVFEYDISKGGEALYPFLDENRAFLGDINTDLLHVFKAGVHNIA